MMMVSALYLIPLYWGIRQACCLYLVEKDWISRMLSGMSAACGLRPSASLNDLIQNFSSWTHSISLVIRHSLDLGLTARHQLIDRVEYTLDARFDTRLLSKPHRSCVHLPVLPMCHPCKLQTSQAVSAIIVLRQRTGKDSCMFVLHDLK